MTAKLEIENERVLSLRREFDASFAAKPDLEIDRFENFLGIRLREDAYAIRLSQISRLLADKKIVPLVGGGSGVLGISGFRGTIVPIYDLGILLGYPPVGAAPRWLIVVKTQRLIAFACDRFDGYHQVLHESISKNENESKDFKHITEVVRIEDAARPIIDITAAVEVIGRTARTRAE